MEEKGFIIETDSGEREAHIGDLRVMADAGNPTGVYGLGMALLFGWDTEPNPAKGYALIRKACEAGNVDAMTLLLKMFFSGEYTDMTPEQAAKYAEKASAAGIPDAQLYYGTAYMDGIGVPKDPVKAVSLFRAAADQGSGEAENSLAYMYLNGQGVGKDVHRALGLFRKAASHECVNALFQTGFCYETGIGCRIDWKKAEKWYLKSLESGDSFAADRLGRMYAAGGNGITADPKKAFEYTVRAASDGITESMQTASEFYRTGFGTDSDLTEADKWAALAKSNRQN